MPESTVVLTYSPDGRVTRVTGNAQGVLGRNGPSLVGLELADSLGLAPAQAEELRTLSAAQSGVRFFRTPGRSEPVTLRISLDRAPAGGGQVEVCELDALLEGAPPLQISRLSSSLSHEIRNPLSSVKMAVQTLARNSGLSPRDQRRLNIANREIRTMERMLSLLSEYGRETASHIDVIALRSLLQEASAAIEPELVERQSTLEIQEGDGLPRVKADSARCRPVLAQLLLNVAMGQEPGTPVVAQLQRDGDGACLRVEDRAATLLPEDRASLFEPFGSRLARGAGLSLAALHRVMQSQGGRVTAEAAGTGTVFTLTFAPA